MQKTSNHSFLLGIGMATYDLVPAAFYGYAMETYVVTVVWRKNSFYGKYIFKC